MTGSEPGTAGKPAQKGQRQDLEPKPPPPPVRAEHHPTDHQRVFFRPDGIGTVTVEEKERFEEIKERLRVLLENQITHFRLEPWRRRSWCSPVLSRLP